MKSMYWKPQRASKVQRALIAAFAVVGLLGVERLPAEEQQPYYGLKIQAARKSKEAMAVIKESGQKQNIRLQEEHIDPSRTLMVGGTLTKITSGSGSLISKQTAVNPNLAAVVVQWLKEAKLKVGDTVAIGVSGSFPGGNLAVYSAVHEMGLHPIIITSVAASQYGANNPKFTWLDMEAAMRKQGVFPYKSVAASRGGVGDDAIGLTKRGRRLIDKAIERNEIPRVGKKNGEEELTLDDFEEKKPEDEDDLAKKVDERMRVYYQFAADRPIKAYINVGGGTVSVGTKLGKRKFKPGLNKRLPRGGDELPPSMIGAFLTREVPAIHVTQIVSIAENYGIEIAPLEMPDVGQGDVFQKRQPNRLLAAFVLALILLTLLLAARAPWGTRILQKAATRNSSPSLRPPAPTSSLPPPVPPSSAPPSGSAPPSAGSVPPPAAQ